MGPSPGSDDPDEEEGLPAASAFLKEASPTERGKAFTTRSKKDLASFSMGILRMRQDESGRNGSRQEGQKVTSGWSLQVSHMTWPFRHWKILTGGLISSRQTEHSKSLLKAAEKSS